VSASGRGRGGNSGGIGSQSKFNNTNSVSGRTNRSSSNSGRLKEVINCRTPFWSQKYVVYYGEGSGSPPASLGRNNSNRSGGVTISQQEQGLRSRSGSQRGRRSSRSRSVSVEEVRRNSGNNNYNSKTQSRASGSSSSGPPANSGLLRGRQVGGGGDSRKAKHNANSKHNGNPVTTMREGRHSRVKNSGGSADNRGGDNNFGNANNVSNISRNENNMSRNEGRRLSGGRNNDRPLDSMSNLSPIKSHSPQKRLGAVRR
jgi:hypothetical protein